MHNTSHPPLLAISSEHFPRWGWHSRIMQHWWSSSVARWVFSSPSKALTTSHLAVHPMMFFSLTSPALYLCLYILISIAASSQSLSALWAPEICPHVSSQCDPNLSTANASLKVSLFCFPSAQNNHEILRVEAACPWTVAEHPVYCD